MKGELDANATAEKAIGENGNPTTEKPTAEIDSTVISNDISKPDSNAQNAGNKTQKSKAKTRKLMKKRSPVWAHFTEGVNEEGLAIATCNYCKKVFQGDSKINGTSNLNHHIQVCKQHPHEVERNQKQLALQLAGAGTNTSSLTTWKFDQQKARKALACMILIDELPFSFVDHEGFKRFVACICPIFQIPSRWTVQRDIYQLYLDEKIMLRKVFEQKSQRVCITTDTWTSIQRMNYMCITAHFVDEDWVLNKKILNFCPITSHKGDDIGKAIETCLYDWGIKRVFTITVDNASSNDVAVTYLKGKFINWEDCISNCEYIHMRCIAHILNLVVCDGLKDASLVVSKVRNYVRYIRHSPARLSRFKQCVEIEKIDCKSSLCLDVSTRWNSTYLMLSTAIKFERAFERYNAKNY